MKVGQRGNRSAAAPPPPAKTSSKKSKASARQAGAAAAAAPAPAIEWEGASLADFTRWNEEATKALRANDGATSRRILTSLLPELRERVRRSEAVSRAVKTSPDDVLQSWRLVYALTLNNYGCQLRRDGQTDEALQQFQAAKVLESAVFGKPSCSTMLNLSAVLLRKGEAKEALAIATECAAAAQDGEPVLFVTALHNLAVALGQQSGERNRSAALPTMLKALREAQAALGEQHPTTRMLKAKCGLTSQWINSSGSATAATTTTSGAILQPESSPKVRRSEYVQPPRTPSPSRPARNGKPAAAHAAETATAPAHAAAAPMLESEASTVAGSSVARASRNMEAQRWDVGPRTSTPSDDVPVAATPAASGGKAASPHVAATRSSGGGASRDSGVAIAVDCLCLDSTNLSVVEATTPDAALEAVLQEPSHPSALAFSRHGAATLRDLCGATQDGGVVYPSFLRFSAPLPRVPTSQSAGIAPTTTAPRLSKEKAQPVSTEGKNMFVQTAPVLSRDLHRDEVPLTPINVAATETSQSLRSASTSTRRIAEAAAATKEEEEVTEVRRKRRPLFGRGTNRWSNKAAQREADIVEEEAYRQRMKEEVAAREAATAFDRGLAEVQARTHHRAAASIQRAWQQWWASVGQPRRHVQLQRMEELQRRRRDRLALSSATGSKKATGKSHTSTVPPPPSQQHGRIAGFVVPAVAVRCAKKWLTRTACVRHVTQLTGYPVDARLHEADVRCRIVRIQAVWRGVLQRRRGTPARPAEEGLRIAARAEAEAREYAAMVVQAAYRLHAARRARARLYKARFDAPAAQIQQWLRSTWADHQLRGVDAATLRVRNAAALCVQRMWRGYLGRLALHMRKLRRRIDEANPYVLPLEAPGDREVLAITHPAGRASADVSPCSPATSAVIRNLNNREDPHAAPTTVVDMPTAPPSSYELQASAYAASCSARSDAVQRLRDEERDHYHIPLYVETHATKERVAWQESIRLRPTEVLRRRAELKAVIEAEQARFARHRAARVIQHAFRDWSAMRHDASRDRSLLNYSLMRYQQHELGRAVAQKQRLRDADRAAQLYGDTTVAMRAERESAALELSEALRDYEDVTGKTFHLSIPQQTVSSRAQERRAREAALHRDERLLALTAEHDAAHLREGPAETTARLGHSYEHPYHNPYTSGEHQHILGID